MQHVYISLVTLIIGNFNSQIREVYDVPSVLQYAHQFPATVAETGVQLVHEPKKQL